MRRALAAFAALAITAPAAAGASTVHGEPGEGWTAVSVNLRPHSHARLVCPEALHGSDMDAAALRPYTLAQGGWVDGGEMFRWTLRGRTVATGRPSQTYGLDRIDFRSYGRPVAVEIVCEGNTQR